LGIAQSFIALLHHCNVRQVAVAVIMIEAASDNLCIGYLKAAVIGLDFRLAR